MDFKNLLLSWKGRIGRQDFWIAFAVLIVANIVLNVITTMAPILGLLGIALMYCWICVYAKRLHDLGFTGWLQLLPYVVLIAAAIAAAVMVRPNLAGMTEGGPGDEAVILQTIAESGGAIGLVGLAMLVSLGFLIWLGAFPGQPGANRFGPPPGEKATAEVF